MDINSILAVLFAWLVTAASFLIIRKVPFIGVEVDSVKIGFISAAVLGIVTTLVTPILGFFGGITNFLTFGLFQGLVALLISATCFGLAAKLVEGFRLNKGIWSAIMGAFALFFTSRLVYSLIEYITASFA